MTTTGDKPATAVIAKARPFPADELPAEISRMSTEQLREELVRQFRLTVEGLLRLAMIVRALEERGEDLSDLRMGLLGYLRRIAYGQVLPEVVVRFAESPALLNRIMSLPLPEQRRLASGEPVRVVAIDGSGNISHRLVDPLRMGREEIGIVFARDHLRDEAEQAAAMRGQALRPRKMSERVTMDRSRGGIVVTGKKVFLSIAEMEQHIESLKAADRESAEAELIPVELRQIVEEEWKRYPRAGRRYWLPVEESLLGRASDRVVAEYLGRSTQTVVHKRTVKGIPAFNRRPPELEKEQENSARAI